MKLIVGLGNPGGQYAATRHNVGFAVVDRLADRLGIAVKSRAWRAEVGDGWHGPSKVVLAKPMTYVNLSGESVRLLVHFFRCQPEDLLVVCDDVELQVGQLRLRRTGSAGGHRGLKSVIQHLGTQGFPRLRIGIGRGAGLPMQAHVLSRFTEEELAVIVPQLDRAAEAALSWIECGIDAAMNRYNAPNP